MTDWSRNYPACLACGTTERKHHSKGRCVRCHDRSRYYARREQMKAWNEANCAQVRAQQRKRRRAYKEAHGVCRNAKWRPGVVVLDPLLGMGVVSGKATNQDGGWVVPCAFGQSTIVLPTGSIQRLG